MNFCASIQIGGFGENATDGYLHGWIAVIFISFGGGVIDGWIGVLGGESFREREEGISIFCNLNCGVGTAEDLAVSLWRQLWVFGAEEGVLETSSSYD